MSSCQLTFYTDYPQQCCYLKYIIYIIYYIFNNWRQGGVCVICQLTTWHLTFVLFSLQNENFSLSLQKIKETKTEIQYNLNSKLMIIKRLQGGATELPFPAECNVWRCATGLSSPSSCWRRLSPRAPHSGSPNWECTSRWGTVCNYSTMRHSDHY